MKDLANKIVAEQEKNRLVVGGMCTMSVMFAVAYFLEVVKGLRGMAEYIIVIALMFIPTIIMLVLYLKKKEMKQIRYVGIIGFLAFYAYVMLTTDKLIVFCYIVVMMTLYTIYGDPKISVICSVAALIINVVTVVKIALTTGLSAAMVTEVEISLACILFITIFSVLSSRLTKKINASQMENLDEEKQQTSDLLDTVLKVAQAMEESIVVLRDETSKLDTSVGNTKDSMEELAEGANSTAEAIQTQQEKTTEIQEYIETLSDVTKRIVGHVNDSGKVVQESQTTMNHLMNQVGNSEKAGSRVAKRMDELKSYTDQMQTIMALINNVASQTGLLALNASIEAARAGEAGRGFAVVATEISNLANQTSSATGDINVLIDGIGQSLEDVVSAVESMLESNQVQTGYVNDTAKDFEDIHGAIGQILEESGKLNEIVKTVALANAAIVESIQNVSASTQEITAKAMETLEGSNGDKESVENVLATVEQLQEHANELSKNQ